MFAVHGETGQDELKSFERLSKLMVFRVRFFKTQAKPYWVAFIMQWNNSKEKNMHYLSFLPRFVVFVINKLFVYSLWSLNSIISELIFLVSFKNK